MEELSQLNTALQLIQQPAFRVEKGMISHVNQAATAYLLQAGQSFAPMILTGGQEYEEFSEGKLYVTLSLAGQSIGACVIREEGVEIVTLEQPAEIPQLRAMALAAAILKEPLSGIVNIAEQMPPAVAAENTKLESQAAQMNQRLYQVLRILNNMSDAATYVHAQAGRMETVEICTFFQEILEKTAALIQDGSVSLAYELPNGNIFTLADSKKLERAVYNLLSNAIKFADPDTTVQAKLVHKNKRLYFSVSNCHADKRPQDNVFHRFMRELTLEDDRRNGVGLGMALVHSTATLHGGAVLMDQTKDGTRITMSLQVNTNASGQVRSPIQLPDYAGEMDHCLVELADVLPAEVYKPENLK